MGDHLFSEEKDGGWDRRGIIVKKSATTTLHLGKGRELFECPAYLLSPLLPPFLTPSPSGDLSVPSTVNFEKKLRYFSEELTNVVFFITGTFDIVKRSVQFFSDS